MEIGGINPITGGSKGRICGPICGISSLYQKPFALVPWNLGLFVTIRWAYCVKILTSYLAQWQLQGIFADVLFAELQVSVIFPWSARCWGLQ